MTDPATDSARAAEPARDLDQVFGAALLADGLCALRLLADDVDRGRRRPGRDVQHLVAGAGWYVVADLLHNLPMAMTSALGDHFTCAGWVAERWDSLGENGRAWVTRVATSVGAQDLLP